MDIKNSRRILFVGESEASVLGVIKDLTGSAPSPHANGSIAGLSHEWNVCTAYYKATVPIWIDEIVDVKQWRTEFLKDEAREVVNAIGAWIYCFGREKDGCITDGVEQVLRSVQEVCEHHSGNSDVVMLAVAKPIGQWTAAEISNGSGQDEQLDRCMEFGFEYIDYTAQGKNEFGENMGFERLKEALEANEWTASDFDEYEPGLDGVDLDTDDVDILTREEAEWTAEVLGIKSVLQTDDEGNGGLNATETEDAASPYQAEEVEELEKLVGKLLAIREQGADLPEEQRKSMAAKAIRDLTRNKPVV